MGSVPRRVTKVPKPEGCCWKKKEKKEKFYINAYLSFSYIGFLFKILLKEKHFTTTEKKKKYWLQKLVKYSGLRGFRIGLSIESLSRIVLRKLLYNKYCAVTVLVHREASPTKRNMKVSRINTVSSFMGQAYCKQPTGPHLVVVCLL